MNSTRSGEGFMLWVDGVGGYWVCLGQEVTLGQPVIEKLGVDIPILGDLSRRHARIRRDGEGYVIEAIGTVRVDGWPIHGAAPLVDGSRIELGDRVRLGFRRPHPLSATARLDFESGHRTQPSTDGVLLMADNCVLGPANHSHVLCRRWPSDVVLFRRGEELGCRAADTFLVDGRPYRQQGPVTWNSRVQGEGFSFSMEGRDFGWPVVAGGG